MSNYTIKVNNPKHEAYIGWDPMMVSLFFHVVDLRKEDSPGYDVEWVGTDFHEILTIEELDQVVKRHKQGGIDQKLWEKLYADMHA